MASGQLVNYDKSALTFSPSTPPEKIQAIQSIFSIDVVLGHDLYLGLPTFSLRSKRLQFSGLRTKILKKINGWATKLFSAGGKEVLIKSVLQSIPNYAMSCFKLPISLCSELEQLCAKFWWSSNNSNGGLHWSKSIKLCIPKNLGGLGFRSLSEFNKALLAKQVWRIIHDPSSLVAQILKARYFKHVDIMEALLGTNPSYVWRSILWSRDLIAKGLFWRVGNGRKIKAFFDKWIPGLASGRSSKITPNLSIMVSDLISPLNSWDEKLVCSHFPSYEVDSILDISLGRNSGEDIRYWKWGPKGHYSVKSGYLVEIGYFDPPPSSSSAAAKTSWRTLIWSLRIPPKVRIFLWRAFNDFIPTELNLLRHHVPTSGNCILCGAFMASSSHCLIFCHRIRKLWKSTPLWIFLKHQQHLSLLDCGIMLAHTVSKNFLELFAMLLWAIWKEICSWKHSPLHCRNTLSID